MNGLDLFSGIGGISLALSPWVRTVAYCESDRFAQGILLSRMRSGDIDPAPIWDDVRTLERTMLPKIDIIHGGFPCQDISAAGRGKGLAGERSGLFFEIVRLTKEIEPLFVFLENVPAIRTRGLSRVLRELSFLGYDCRWTVVSAAELGAPHLRKRWFLLGAHSARLRLRDERGRWCRSNWKGATEPFDDGEEKPLADSEGKRRREARGLRSSQSSQRPTGGGEDVAHATRELREWSGPEGDRRAEYSDRSENVADPDGKRGIKRGTRPEVRGWDAKSLGAGPCFDPGWWSIEPDVGRVAHGIPFRVDRLRGLGNAVVPCQAREAFKRLAGIGFVKERLL